MTAPWNVLTNDPVQIRISSEYFSIASSFTFYCLSTRTSVTIQMNMWNCQIAWTWKADVQDIDHHTNFPHTLDLPTLIIVSFILWAALLLRKLGLDLRSLQRVTSPTTRNKTSLHPQWPLIQYFKGNSVTKT